MFSRVDPPRHTAHRCTEITELARSTQGAAPGGDGYARAVASGCDVWCESSGDAGGRLRASSGAQSKSRREHSGPGRGDDDDAGDLGRGFTLLAGRRLEDARRTHQRHQDEAGGTRRVISARNDHVTPLLAPSAIAPLIHDALGCISQHDRSFDGAAASTCADALTLAFSASAVAARELEQGALGAALPHVDMVAVCGLVDGMLVVSS